MLDTQAGLVHLDHKPPKAVNSKVVPPRWINWRALLADGWHMSTHVAAFLITAMAYHFSHRQASAPRYSFGTGKVGVLGGFASAVVLAVIALLMAGESVHRSSFLSQFASIRPSAWFGLPGFPSFGRNGYPGFCGKTVEREPLWRGATALKERSTPSFG